jgi:hypothetical protein
LWHDLRDLSGRNIHDPDRLHGRSCHDQAVPIGSPVEGVNALHLREERAGAQLRDPKLQIAGGGGQGAKAGAVSLCQASLGPLERRGPDHGRELGIDQGLVDGLGRLADPVGNICGLQRLQELE